MINGDFIAQIKRKRHGITKSDHTAGQRAANLDLYRAGITDLDGKAKPKRGRKKAEQAPSSTQALLTGYRKKRDRDDDDSIKFDRLVAGLLKTRGDKLKAETNAQVEGGDGSDCS